MTERLKEAADIVRTGRGRDEHFKLFTLAWEIFVAGKRRSQEGEHLLRYHVKDFVPTRREIVFQEFVYSWSWWFMARGIPFDEWKDICDEGMLLTQKLLEGDPENCWCLEGAEELVAKKSERIQRLRLSDRYAEVQKKEPWVGKKVYETGWSSEGWGTYGAEIDQLFQ